MENIKENKSCSEEEGCVNGQIGDDKSSFKICFSADNSNENKLCWTGVKRFNISKVEEPVIENRA